jgi:hypothetical protein
MGAGIAQVCVQAGLEILDDELEPLVEPGHGEVSFHWLLARKPLPGREHRAAEQRRPSAARELGKRAQ